MAEMRDDRRPNGTTVPPNNPTTFDDAVQEFELGTLLCLPPELHDALATEARREILAYLYGIDRAVPITELADYLAAIGAEGDRRQAVTGLRHTYLPKLDDAGLIRWNQQEETARLSSGDGD